MEEEKKRRGQEWRRRREGKRTEKEGRRDKGGREKVTESVKLRCRVPSYVGSLIVPVIDIVRYGIDLSGKPFCQFNQCTPTVNHDYMTTGDSLAVIHNS